MGTTYSTKGETKIHVTRVSSTGDVYGHDTSHCDICGCNGIDHYFPGLRGSVVKGDGGCVVGEVVRY